MIQSLEITQKTLDKVEHDLNTDTPQETYLGYVSFPDVHVEATFTRSWGKIEVNWWNLVTSRTIGTTKSCGPAEVHHLAYNGYDLYAQLTVRK